MAPELFEKALKYTSKIDIYSMGCVFYKICCLEDYQKEDYELIDGRYKTNIVAKKEMPTNYDVDLMKIIKEMLNKDANKRPDSGKVLEEVKFNYNKVFIQNSGFYSVLRCMANLPYIRNKFKKILNEDNKDDKSLKNSYSERFLYFIENEQKWIENITFFRHKIVEENNFLNSNKEINPGLIFSFIVNKIHGELNRVEKNEEEYKIKKKISNIDLTKKPMKEEKVLREYINLYNSNFNSIISKYFLGHMETIRICSKCNIETFLFTYYFFLDFDLNLPLLKKREKKEIDLIELFKIQNEISLDLKGLKKIMCVNCDKELEHKESNLFYIFPNQLVILFDRGNEYENTIKINYPEILDLSSIPRGKKFSPKLFQLVGIIKRCDIGNKEHYISLILNSKNWYLYDNEKSEKIKSLSEHKDGKIVMLFYESAKMK
jgi:ubiquitin C-terminal hydrolase